MSNFNDIKKRLAMSTTMPAGSGGAPQWMMGSAAHHHHEHKADGSCCDHDHSHDHDHDDDEDECDGDHTNPSGSCC